MPTSTRELCRHASQTLARATCAPCESLRTCWSPTKFVMSGGYAFYAYPHQLSWKTPSDSPWRPAALTKNGRSRPAKHAPEATVAVDAWKGNTQTPANRWLLISSVCLRVLLSVLSFFLSILKYICISALLDCTCIWVCWSAFVEVRLQIYRAIIHGSCAHRSQSSGNSAFLSVVVDISAWTRSQNRAKYDTDWASPPHQQSVAVDVPLR